MLKTTASLALAFAATALSPAAEAQTPLTTERIVAGVGSLTDIQWAPGDPSTRFFTVQRQGTIRIVENGVASSTPFLNISSIVQSGGEQGLLGLAFHPNYENNGRFFVNYTTNGGATRVSEFNVTANPDVASSTVVNTIAAINQDFGNHNGGCIQFGPDGKLYVGMGDGGSGNDPNGRAQNGNSLLGKMLRYDVDIAAPFIPADNPFVGTPSVRDEIWLIGLRNPWRFSFDSATGDMYIADVGQNAREEVDFIPAGAGGLNLGWRCLEGNRCTGLSGCSCSDAALVDPILEYNQNFANGGFSITGGYVYRGSAIPDLNGAYFYADYVTSNIWSLEYNGTSVQNVTRREDELDPAVGTLSQISTFGQDPDGELYIGTLNGQIFQIVPEAPPCGGTNYCQAVPSNLNGVAAMMGSGGTAEIGQNNFSLFTSGVPSSQFGLYFYGPAQQQAPSGQGNLCVNGAGGVPLVRLPDIVQADIFGSVFYPLDLTDPLFVSGPAPITAGSTWNFQFWFRDVDLAGAPSWNYSDGLSVLFCP